MHGRVCFSQEVLTRRETFFKRPLLRSASFRKNQEKLRCIGGSNNTWEEALCMTNCIAYICDFNPKCWSSRRKCNDWDGLFVLKTNLRYQIEKVLSVEKTFTFIYYFIFLVCLSLIEIMILGYIHVVNSWNVMIQKVHSVWEVVYRK